MRIDHKALVLLTAAVLGSGLIACQRAGEDPRASNQGAATPMNQAPKQGYTGPASPSPSTPAGGMSSEEKGGQPASQSDTPSYPGTMKQPDETGQEKTQR